MRQTVKLENRVSDHWYMLAVLTITRQYRMYYMLNA